MESATETVADAVDLIAGESSVESDALEDEVSVLTDDVEIGEEFLESVSAPVGDVEDSDEAIEGVDVKEAAEPRGEADEDDESATETVADAVDLIAGVEQEKATPLKTSWRR